MDEHKWLEVNVSLSLGVNETGKPPVPEARIDAAGGVWDNLLWLSMGRNKDKRTLSDLWVLTLNTAIENGALEIVGEPLSLSLVLAVLFLAFFEECTYKLLGMQWRLKFLPNECQTTVGWYNHHS